MSTATVPLVSQPYHLAPFAFAFACVWCFEPPLPPWRADPASPIFLSFRRSQHPQDAVLADHLNANQRPCLTTNRIMPKAGANPFIRWPLAETRVVIIHNNP